MFKILILPIVIVSFPAFSINIHCDSLMGYTVKTQFKYNIMQKATIIFNDQEIMVEDAKASLKAYSPEDDLSFCWNISTNSKRKYIQINIPEPNQTKFYGELEIKNNGVEVIIPITCSH